MYYTMQSAYCPSGFSHLQAMSTYSAAVDPSLLPPGQNRQETRINPTSSASLGYIASVACRGAIGVTWYGGLIRGYSSADNCCGFYATMNALSSPEEKFAFSGNNLHPDKAFVFKAFMTSLKIDGVEHGYRARDLRLYLGFLKDELKVIKDFDWRSKGNKFQWPNVLLTQQKDVGSGYVVLGTSCSSSLTSAIRKKLDDNSFICDEGC